MLSGLQAILLCRGERSWQQQSAIAEPYARHQGYRIGSITPSEEDALVLAHMLAKTGHEPVVLTLIAGPDDRRLALRLEEVGARLEYCRAQRQPKPLKLDLSNTEELVVGMYRREVTTSSISAVLKVPVSRVRAIIARFRHHNG